MTSVLNKSGADPTTFSVTTGGAANADGTSSTVRTNAFNGFDCESGTQALAVGLTGVSTATVGHKGGTVTIGNTDLMTVAGRSTGNADGNDTIDLSLCRLDHSNASFAATADVNTMVLNFQDVLRGSTGTMDFGTSNLLSASGFTARPDLDFMTGTGDTGAFAMNLSTFSAMAAGDTGSFAASFTPTGAGVHYATYTLGVPVENLSGATTGSSLKLIMTGSAASTTVPEPVIPALVPTSALILLRRRSVA